jgi:hypothetical protein
LLLNNDLVLLQNILIVKQLNLKTRKGSAAPTRGSVAQVRSKYKVSHKVTYKYDDPVNKTSNDQWSILNILFSSSAK